MTKTGTDPKVIGITIGLHNSKESMWINGIKMNAIFLGNALKAAGHHIYLLDTSTKVGRNEITGKLNSDELMWDDEKFPCYDWKKKGKECDILICLGTSLGPEQAREWRGEDKHKKIIKYACGNNYVIDMENMIFKEDPGVRPTYNHELDAVWYVPQQQYQNHEYYRVTNRLLPNQVNCVPFVWDPMFIDKSERLYGETFDAEGNVMPTVDGIPVYHPNKKIEDKQIVVFEPNLNVVKFSMIPLLIANDYLMKGGEVFSKFHIVSAQRLFKNPFWKEFVGGLDIAKLNNKDSEPILQVQHRWPVHFILAKWSDIVISHQWENPLNYAYLDCLYLQFPLIHNADFIKDAGYYYPDFEIGKGADLLNHVMKNHDVNMDAYNEQSEEVLTRYTILNEDLVLTYSKLIDNLWEGSNKHNLTYEYNWKTNLYFDSKSVTDQKEN